MPAGKTLYLRMTDELRDAVDEFAAREGISVSAAGVMLIKSGLLAHSQRDVVVRRSVPHRALGRGQFCAWCAESILAPVHREQLSWIWSGDE